MPCNANIQQTLKKSIYLRKCTHFLLLAIWISACARSFYAHRLNITFSLSFYLYHSHYVLPYLPLLPFYSFVHIYINYSSILALIYRYHVWRIKHRTIQHFIVFIACIIYDSTQTKTYNAYGYYNINWSLWTQKRSKMGKKQQAEDEGKKYIKRKSKHKKKTIKLSTSKKALFQRLFIRYVYIHGY